MKKKIIIVFLMALLFIPLVGCVTKTTENTTTTGTSLSAIEDLSIVKGVVSFSEVSGASEYVLRVYTVTDSEIEFYGNYTVTNGYNLTYALEDGKYAGKIRYTLNGVQSEFSEEVNFDIGDYTIETMNAISGEDLTNKNYINFNGRTYYETESLVTARNDSMFLFYTASGFKVNFYGTELKVTFYATGASGTTNCAYIVVLIDGEIYPDGGTTIALNKGEVAEYTLATGLTEGNHSVEVLKRSEASDNLTAVKSVNTDGHFLAPSDDRNMQILVIGASGSCGYGDLAKTGNATKNTYNSDGLKSFPYLVSRMYDADITEVNASGWGLKWGWNSHDGEANLVSAFSKVGISSNNSVYDVNYDYTKDHYDLIILNIGINDFSYINGSIAGSFDETSKLALIEQYKVAIKEFYMFLHTYYQDAVILVTSTSFTDQNQEGYYNSMMISAAKEEFSPANDFAYTITIPANGSGTNYGANYHANVQTHIWSADAIDTWLQQNVNFVKVRNNITFVASRDQVN